MRFAVQFPLDEPERSDQAVTMSAVARFARTAENAGFDAIAFTEHPAPSPEWLSGAYGHAALDPFAALAFCAGVTSRIRLMTYLAVLPYRSPLMTAKAAATVDRLSDGRLILGVGTGYLRSEFAALGVAFDARREIFEQSLSTLDTLWSGEGGRLVCPRPIQQPRPPIWIGGNSRRVREQVARHGDGWSPLLVDARLAADLTTRGFSSLTGLRSAVAELRDMVADQGRDPATVDVQVKGGMSRVTLAQLGQEHYPARLAELADAGATWMVVHPEARSRAELLDVLTAFGHTVISGPSGQARDQ